MCLRIDTWNWEYSLSETKLVDLQFQIALIYDVSHLNGRTLNDGMIAWSHGILGAKTFKMASEEDT